MTATDIRTASKASKNARRATTMMAAAVLGAIGAANNAHAVDLFWDGDGAGPNTGGSGQWLGTDTWHGGTATGTLQSWANGSDAKFVQTVPSATGTVTITAPVAANSIEFLQTSGAYTITGSSISVGTAGIKITNPTGEMRITSNLGSTDASGNINYIRGTSNPASTSRLALQGAANTFTGNINVTGTAVTGAITTNLARLDLNTAGALPAGSDINFSTNNGAITNSGVNGTVVTFAPDQIINFNAGGSGTTQNGAIGAGTGNSIIVNSVIAGNVNLYLQSGTGGGAGTVTLNAQNTYTGDTILNATASTGHTHLGVNNALPTTTTLQFGATTFPAPALNLGGFNQTIGALKTVNATIGATTVGIVNAGTGTSTLTINGNQTTTYASTIGTPLAAFSNLPSATGSYNNIAVVLGAGHTGSLTLTRTNDYTGGTTINGGGLVVNNNPIDGSATGDGAVVVNAGSLGGTGKINGPVSLAAGTPGQATLNPGGVGTAEDIQVGGLTLGSGNFLNFDFAPTLQDKIVVSGNVTLPASGDIDINLNDLGGLVSGTYPLIAYSGALTGAFSTLSIGTAPGGSTYTLLNDAGVINLRVQGTANNRSWAGTVNNVWDVNTTANWAGNSKFVNGDIATFGDGAANTTITVAAGGVSPGGMNFTADGTTYTFNGAAIGGTGGLTKTGAGLVVLNNSNTFTGGVNLGGGTLALSSGNAIAGASAVNISNNATLQANGAVTSNRPVSIDTGGGTINTNGNAMTLSGAVTGAGLLTKTGSGVLTLSGTSPTFTGGTQIDGGTVRVNSVSGADNVTGAGVGQISVNNGGTFHIDNISMGTSTVPTANGASIVLNSGGTLLASGNASYGKSGGFQVAVGAGDVNVNTVAASDTLTFKNSLRRAPAGGGDTNATIHVGGPGRVLIESGPVSSNNTYSGSWDVASGILQLGPVDSAGFGEALNGLGFKESDPKNGNTVTVSGGTLAGAVNTPNPASSAAATTPNFFRANVVMSGGKIGSTGLDAAYGGDFTTTAATTSQVLVADAVTGATPRNVNLVAGAAGANNNAASTNWNGNLVVTPGALANGGAFNISRDGGTVTVTPGASLQINSGATVNLNGTADALSSGTDHVNVVNNGTFNVSNGTKNVGNISGTTGATAVSGGATLNANHVRGGSLTAASSTVVIRPSGGTGAGVSKVNSLAITGTGKVDLKDNKLITNTPAGTFTGGAYTGVQGDVARAYNFGSWDQPGLMTSMPDAGPLVGTTTVGVGTAEQILFLGPTQTATVFGQTVTGASTIAMYTYAGDVNFDGLVDGGDYGVIDNFFATPGSDGYANGDLNYDGVIDGGDYGIIDNTFALQGAPFLGVNDPFASGASAASAGLSGVTAVPEPASLTVLAIGAAGLLGRRRRTK